MTYDERPTPAVHLRRAALSLGLVVLLAFGLATAADAGGGKFTYKNKKDKASMLWQSYVDNEAYLSSTVTGRQSSGGRGMFMKVDHLSLRCSGGGQDCFTVGAGPVQLGEGASFHSDNDKRFHPNLPKRYGLRKVLSTELNRGASLMRGEHYLCVDRSIIPDTCSRPRLSNHPY